MNGEPGRDAPDPRHIVDRSTLDMLVCPLTKTRLSLSTGKTELISRAARVAFPIRNGVPMLCLDEARQLSEKECQKLNC